MQNVWDLAQHALKSGFLQVSKNWKKLGNLSGQGKVRGKYFSEKSGEK